MTLEGGPQENVARFKVNFKVLLEKDILSKPNAFELSA